MVRSKLTQICQLIESGRKDSHDCPTGEIKSYFFAQDKKIEICRFEKKEYLSLELETVFSHVVGL